MATRRKLNIAVSSGPVMTVSRAGVRHQKMCYVIKANRLLRYPTGKSRIAYIGTTEIGIHRLAQSAAERSGHILGSRGITSFEVFVLTCRSAPGVQTWRLLERALLMTFRDTFGDVPLANWTGMGFKERDEFDYFTRRRVRDVLTYL